MSKEMSKLLESDYDCTIHFPTHRTCFVNEALKVDGGTTISVGNIYRSYLDHTKRIIWDELSIPDHLKFAVRSTTQRNMLQKGFNLNSRRSPYPWWLKSNSAFVAFVQYDGGAGFVLDVLKEHPQNERDVGSVLHKYLREEFDCYNNALKLSNHCNALSGHLSGTLISNKSVSGIFLFDKYSHSDAYENGMTDIERIMINRLWENRIMPITTDAYPILPSEYRYKFSLDK